MPRRRTIFAISLYTTLGAATTVGVAWGAAIANPPLATFADEIGFVSVPNETEYYYEIYLINELAYWRGSFLRQPGPPPDPKAFEDCIASLLVIRCDQPEPLDIALLDGRVSVEFIDQRLGPLTPNERGDGWSFTEIYITFAGAPMTAFQGEFRRDFVYEARERWTYPNTIVIKRWDGEEVELPLRPVWPGFAVDTAFYAFFWLGMLKGPGKARGAVRRRKGRCPRCAYDLGGALASGCSECGWGR